MSLLRELLVLTEARKLSFACTDVEKQDDYIMALVVANEHDDSSYGEDYHGVNVLFHSDGTTDAATADKKSEAEWAEHRDEIIKVAIPEVLRGILWKVRDGRPGSAAEDIKWMRACGHDLPQFKTIEKSINAAQSTEPQEE